MSKARQLAQKPNQPTGRKNLVINGAMNVSQRHRDTERTGVTGGVDGLNYVVDRFVFWLSSLGTWRHEQEADAPNGFKNSLKLTCTTSDNSPAASDYAQLNYKFEGQELQLLEYGLSSAKAVTISFYVKSSKTGTYVCRLYNPDTNRANHVSYTINTADTWERKELTFVGDTGNSITNDETQGLRLTWWLGAGSDYSSGTSLSPANSWGAYVATDSAVGQVNVADTNNATWQITGVQMEVGRVATDFEHLPVEQELHACQRYYCQIPHDSNGDDDFAAYPMWIYSNSNASTRIKFPRTMVRAPSVSLDGTLSADDSPTSDEWGVYSDGAWRTGSGGSITVAEVTHDSVRFNFNRTSAFTSGYSAGLYIYNSGGSTNNRIRCEAELA